MNEIPKIITPEVVNPEKQEVRERIHERVISGEDRDQYAKLTEDYNTVHFGDDAICHGMHIVSLVSGATTKEFGNGSVFIGIDSLEMRGPIKVGTPFRIVFDDPEPMKGATKGEHLVFATVAKQVKITSATEPEGFRYKYKEVMCAMFQVTIPVVPSTETSFPTSPETLA